MIPSWNGKVESPRKIVGPIGYTLVSLDVNPAMMVILLDVKYIIN